ncbi:MAG: coiled coil domain-containing protein [Desulfatiglandales bacterium]
MTEKRDAYVKKLKAKMDEWNAEIDKIEAQADQAEAEAKIEYYRQVEDLRAKRRDVEDKMAELQKAGDGAWEDLKAGIESAWDSLGNALKSAASRFKS